jgi:hypothetical protein
MYGDLMMKHVLLNANIQETLIDSKMESAIVMYLVLQASFGDLMNKDV